MFAHVQPCGTGALDGGIERSQNFKKVLDTFFGGSPPQISSPVSTADSPMSPSEENQSASTPRPSRQPVSPTSEEGLVINSDTFIELADTLEKSKDDIDNKLFLYQTPAYQWIPSSVYRYDDFFESLFVMATDGVSGKRFYIGEDVDNGHVYGLVNIAAFLGQSMKETIQYDACDENSVRNKFSKSISSQFSS